MTSRLRPSQGGKFHQPITPPISTQLAAVRAERFAFQSYAEASPGTPLAPPVSNGVQALVKCFGCGHVVEREACSPDLAWRTWWCGPCATIRAAMEKIKPPPLMGMFDYVAIDDKSKLPNRPQWHVDGKHWGGNDYFQTKDLEDNLALFAVTADDRLVVRRGRVQIGSEWRDIYGDLDWPYTGPIWLTALGEDTCEPYEVRLDVVEGRVVSYRNEGEFG